MAGDHNARKEKWFAAATEKIGPLERNCRWDHYGYSWNSLIMTFDGIDDIVAQTGFIRDSFRDTAHMKSIVIVTSGSL